MDAETRGFFSVSSMPFLVCMSLVVLSPPAFGEEGAEQGGAVVEGHVLGPHHEPVSGVEVRLRSGSKTLDAKALSNSGGSFRLEGIPAPGTYQVVCSFGSRVETGPAIVLHDAAEVVRADVALRLSFSEDVSVTADAWTLPNDVPNSTATRTTEALGEQNLFNPEDALKYVPNTTIRKRYIGDRNSLIGGRSFGTLQPSRGLVYLDGYLLSNFLGRFDAPRWNMVTPEALERVDVMYGPFSAIHAGNSIGTTVVMTERTPKNLEWSANLTGYGERFSQYGDTHNYRGGQLSAYLGARLDSGPWGALTFNHQDSISHPLQYYTVSADASGAFPFVAGPATPVTGIRYDTDPKANRRAVFGPNAGAIDHAVQDSLKLRFGYAFMPDLEASGLVAGWTDNSNMSDRTFLRDSANNEVWQGRVTDGVNTFNIPPIALARSTREETHLQLGATLKTRRAAGWNASLIASDYLIVRDPARQANNPDPVAAAGGPGTVTRRDGTGWNTLEAQATYTPSDGDFGHGRHALTFGVHRNAYTLKNVVDDASDWRGAETTLNQRYRGETQVIALYAQDAWKLRDDLKVTFGWREEWFRTFDGEQLVHVATCTVAPGAVCDPIGDGMFNKIVPYPSRTLAGESPKASLTWTATNHLLVRASFGRGVRFPNVEELYNGTVTATSVTLSDPNLKAERSNAYELSSEMFWSRHTLRATLFHDDIRDAILRQSDITVTPSITNVSNADLVRTSGVEFAWTARDVGIRGLSCEASGALTSSKVAENAKDPASVGKYWLRVPKTRANALVAYRPTAQWMGSVGWRYQGRAYNDVYNLDINPNVYGGVSEINEADVRLSYRPQPKVELAVGIDNVTDHHAYVSHPYPGRTLFIELRSFSR